jgi:hypothetical protein
VVTAGTGMFQAMIQGAMIKMVAAVVAVEYLLNLQLERPIPSL